MAKPASAFVLLIFKKCIAGKLLQYLDNSDNMISSLLLKYSFYKHWSPVNTYRGLTVSDNAKCAKNYAKYPSICRCHFFFFFSSATYLWMCWYLSGQKKVQWKTVTQEVPLGQTCLTVPFKCNSRVFWSRNMPTSSLRNMLRRTNVILYIFFCLFVCEWVVSSGVPLRLWSTTTQKENINKLVWVDVISGNGP